MAGYPPTNGEAGTGHFIGVLYILTHCTYFSTIFIFLLFRSKVGVWLPVIRIGTTLWIKISVLIPQYLGDFKIES